MASAVSGQRARAGGRPARRARARCGALAAAGLLGCGLRAGLGFLGCGTAARPQEADPQQPRRLALLGAAAAVAGAGPAQAFFGISGPVSMPLEQGKFKYEEVPCNANKGETLKGTFATKGLLARCVKVTTTVVNPSGKELQRAGVFGRINDPKAQTSVLANAVDGSSDVGQFTIVQDTIKATDKPQEVSFRFVAALPKDEGKDPLPKLEFKQVKITWYPGGDRYEPVGSCQRVRGFLPPGCDEDDL